MPDEQKIFEEWQKFQEGLDIDRSVVRDFIYRSWVRCRKLNVDPVRAVRKVLPPSHLEEYLRKNKSLIQSSMSIMERIYGIISSSGSIFSLASADGVILFCLSSEGKLIVPGLVSSEANIGTVGIATCMEEKRQLEIFAAEHYCVEFHKYVCSAAPIIDKQGKLLGFLGLTSLSGASHPHTGGLLAAAVYAIAEQVGLREILGEQTALLGLIDEGVVTLDFMQRIRLINAKALSMLGFSRSPLEQNVFDCLQFSSSVTKLIEAGEPFQDMETTISSVKGGNSIICMVSSSVSSDAGTVLTLREAERMRDFVNRFTGAKATYSFDDIIGQSKPIREAITKAKKIARSDTTVLLLGESGTGKELFAQSLHNESMRRGKPFVIVNCGALPRDLIQSELFGYTEGSFTGASRQGKPGKFELADGGTIFLDEIGEMPLDVQVNLLRLLQNREVMRIGDKRSRIVDIRIIAATNRDLFDEVRKNTFREDLYYRLNVFPIKLPSLRERVEDIQMLADHFLEKFAKVSGSGVKGISSKAMTVLNRYSWPGNIRELENTMERAVYMASEELLSVDDLAENIVAGASHGQDSGRCRRAAEPDEKEELLEALRRNRGHVNETIDYLGIPRSTFYYRIRKYGISVKDYRNSRGASGGGDANPLSELTTEQLSYLAEFAKKMLVQHR